jgi:hypothetical protein
MAPNGSVWPDPRATERDAVKMRGSNGSARVLTNDIIGKNDQISRSRMEGSVRSFLAFSCKQQGPAVRAPALRSLCQAQANIPSGQRAPYGPISGLMSGQGLPSRGSDWHLRAPEGSCKPDRFGRRDVVRLCL